MKTDSITSTALASRINGELRRRRQGVGQLQQEIALLSTRMIAERVRAKHPDVVAFGLNYTDQDGDYRVPGGYYTTATAADEAVEDDELDDVLYEYCGDLDDGNATAWQPFTIDGSPGALWDSGHVRLLVDAALRIDADRLAPPQVRIATICDGWLVCPHCCDRDSIVEIDSATRKHRISVVSADQLGAHMEDGDFQTIGFQCTNCDHEVDVPFEVYHD
jgi:hypothetical protein